jgi:hypothetical protein
MLFPPFLRKYMKDEKERKPEKMPTGRKYIKRIGCGCLTLICAIFALSAASNLFFSNRSKSIDRLADLEKARIAEVFHLRETIGNSIWPGWSNASIPIIVYNEAYAFLIGLENPDPGWRTVPQNIARGGSWELVSGATIDGRKYYRQKLINTREVPQAFTVRVGDFWSASMTTKEWTPIKMGNNIRDGLPSAIKAIVPYRLIARIFLGLAMNTDGYICAIEHESFHAYQGIMAADRLASAEIALSQLGKKYPWFDSAFNNAWKAELNTLADALSASQEQRMAELATQFVSMRQARRKAFQLDADLRNLERLREWEEGLAKYTELAIWKHAALDSTYKPVQALRGDPDFKSYGSFAGKWAAELTTLRRQSKGDEVRFYYSGMAQAFLLDRLNPDWRSKILQRDVFLEDLLDEALAGRK